MEQLELDAGGAARADVPHGFDHVVGGLSGKAQNDVRDDVYTSSAQLPDGLVIDGQRIATADHLRRFFVNGLEPELHPDGLYPVHFLQQVQHVWRQAVRPCPYGESDDLREGKHLPVEGLEPFDWSGWLTASVYSARSRETGA